MLLSALAQNSLQLGLLRAITGVGIGGTVAAVVVWRLPEKVDFLIAKRPAGALNKHKAASIVVDFITPETETSHWYVWGVARNFKPDDAALTDTIRTEQHTVFSEDLQMLQ